MTPAAADDEESVRPDAVFNPLLFRALQTVAKGLEPPYSQSGNGAQGGGATGGTISGVVTAAGTPAEETEVPADPPAKDANGVKRRGKK